MCQESAQQALCLSNRERLVCILSFVSQQEGPSKGYVYQALCLSKKDRLTDMYTKLCVSAKGTSNGYVYQALCLSKRTV